MTDLEYQSMKDWIDENKMDIITQHARYQLIAWLQDERKNYADVKWKDGESNRESLIQKMKEEGWTPTWTDFAYAYMKRAELMGPDTLQGRQAMGKAVVTLMHILETAIMVFGPMPEPGHTSGEIVEWPRPTTS